MATQTDKYIAGLEADNKRLRAVLRPFALYGRILDGQKTRSDTSILELFDIKITGQDFSNAASALEQ